MNKLEWDLTIEFNQDYGWIPDVIIYLKCPPKVCLERIKQRNCHENISLDYYNFHNSSKSMPILDFLSTNYLYIFLIL